MDPAGHLPWPDYIEWLDVIRLDFNALCLTSMPQQLVFSQCLQLRTDGGRKVLADAIDGHPVTKCGAEVC